MKRTKHNLSHYHLTTFDMGELIPVANFEALPGDTIRMATSALIRVSPLTTPVMHPVTVRIHHWFVPYRLIWNGSQSWEDFITGGPDGVFGGTYPVHNIGTNGANGTLGSYLGVPLNGNAAITLSQLPFRAYYRIWNEHYRDQDLVPEATENSAADIKKIAWEKDYFTSARPWTQKGPAVSVPMGQLVVKPSATEFLTTAQPAGMALRDAATGAVPGVNQHLMVKTGTPGFVEYSTTAATAGAGDNLFPSNLYADGTTSTATVNQWRLAMALQRYQEARAQYGDRYPEYLAYLGVRPRDGRLDRPEYLGGGKTTVSFSEVLRTGDGGTPSAANPIGDLNGHGIAAMRSRSWVRFFEEHGQILTLASVRPRSIYLNGLHRQWSRRDKTHYWQPELERIGQQEITNKEIYAPGASPDGVFGYQDRYAEYRHIPSYVSGDFRDSTMNDWHFGRDFGAAPTLNQAFIECVPGKRPMAEQTRDSLWAMFNHKIVARRKLGRGGQMGRII